MKLFKTEMAKSSKPPPPPPPHGAPRPSKADRRQRNEEEETTAALRQASPSGRRAFNLKFRFNGCWHCGEKGHSRKANPSKGIAGCPKFEKLKAQNGGNVPAGYKGAYEKARDAAWEKLQKSKSSKVNHLGSDESDYEDDMSEFF